MGREVNPHLGILEAAAITHVAPGIVLGAIFIGCAAVLTAVWWVS